MRRVFSSQREERPRLPLTGACLESTGIYKRQVHVRLEVRRSPEKPQYLWIIVPLVKAGAAREPQSERREGAT